MSSAPLSLEENRRLVAMARRVREGIVRVVYESGSGHIGGALSQTDVLCALYSRYLRIDAKNPAWPARDRFVLSKGHGGLGLAVVLAECGFFPVENLKTFGKTGSALGMHMDHRRVPGIELATGSLGHGLGVSVGMALGAQKLNLPTRVVCLLSDGECYEGSTWEAALSAPALGLGSRLCVVVDRNRMTMDGLTENQVPLEPLAEKWRAFGFCVLVCDGHDFGSICAALDAALDGGQEKPVVVIANTVKGKGIDFMEERPEWHYGSVDSEMFARALASIAASYDAACGLLGA